MEAALKKAVQAKALELIEGKVEVIVKKYLRHAERDPATARHYVDKLLGTDPFDLPGPNSATLTIRVRRWREGGEREARA